MDVNELWNEAFQALDTTRMSAAEVQRAVAALNALQREWAPSPFPFAPMFGEMTADECRRAWGEN